MAVARTATAAGTQSSGSSTTLAATATCDTSTTDNNTYAVFIANCSVVTNAATTTLALTYGGVPMVQQNLTRVGSTTSRAAVGLYTLQNPPTGAQNVVATSGVTTQTAVALGGGVYSGVGALAPTVTSAATTGLTVTSEADGYIVVGTSNGAALSAPNRNSLYLVASSPTGVGDSLSVQDVAGAASVAFTNTGTATTPQSLGISLKSLKASPEFQSVGADPGVASRSSMPVNVPAGLAADDIVLMTIYGDATAGTSVGTPPTGFTELPNSPIATTTPTRLVFIRTFWKRQTSATGAGETTGTYTFPMGRTLACTGGAARYSGCIQSGDPVNVSTSAAAEAITSTWADIAAITTTVDNTTLVWMTGRWSNGATTTAPTGFTLRTPTSAGGQAWDIADKVQAAAGSTGTITGALGADQPKVAWVGALTPLGGSTPPPPAASIQTNWVAMQRANLY